MENEKSSKMPLPTLIEFEPCLNGGAPVKKDHQAHLRTENAIKIVIILRRIKNEFLY